MDDTVHFLGWVLKPIHVSIISNVIYYVFLIGSVMLGFLFARWSSRGNRELHIYVDSWCKISEIDKDKRRTLAIRDFGKQEYVDRLILRAKVRKWLIDAAFRCDWTHRFIKDPNPSHQLAILDAIGVAVARHYTDGIKADTMSFSTTPEKKLLYSATGSDTDETGVRMIRVIVVTEKVLEIVRDHPDTDPNVKDSGWLFELKYSKEQPRLRVRLQTLRNMAKAYFEDDGFRAGEDGTRVRIIGEVMVCERI